MTACPGPDQPIGWAASNILGPSRHRVGRFVKYISTRGAAPALSFDDALLAGLACDGGLYVPETWPRLTRPDLRALFGLSYAEAAARVMAPFIGAAVAEDDFAAMVADAYRDFDHPAVAPLTQLGRNQWLLELFHGPTLSFKDYALQLVGRLFDHVLARRGQRIALVCATSGDTGSAAIEACRDRPSLDIFVLHPKGRVSDVQRRQMTTVMSSNVHNVAVEGTFDDCQDLVKAMFNDRAFRDRCRLSAVNSINWARIMAQAAYYVVAAVGLGAPGRRFTFAVPTGNFGNVYAAYAARRMGLPVGRIRHRLQRQRRADTLLRHRRDAHGAGPPDAEPEHGHPSVEQFRAPAVRLLRPRRRPAGRGHGTLPEPRTGRLRQDPVAPHGAPVRRLLGRRRGDQDGDKDHPPTDRRAPRSALRHRRRRRHGAPRSQGLDPWSLWPRPILPSSPRRWRRRRASVPPCRPVSPTSTSARSASMSCPTISRRCRNS